MPAFPKDPHSPTAEAGRAGGSARPLTPAALWTGLGLCALVYLAQPLRNGPNPVDEGLLLGVLDALAHGQELHHDVLDLYGPAHWAPLRWAYLALGQRVLGARLYLLALKAIGLGLSVWLVARLSDRYHALLCGVWLTVLLGVPWQLLQAPYPFLQAWVLALGTYHLLLFMPPARSRARWTRVLAAGCASGIAIATKLNAGLFLLAGGLFVLAFGQTRAPASAHAPRWLRWLGLGLFGAAFTLASARHMSGPLAAFLWWPLFSLLVFTARTLARGDRLGDLPAAALYAASCLATLALVLSISFGVAGASDYVQTIARILAALDYTAPVPTPLQPGPYVGFNESGWPLLLWLDSAVLSLIALRAGRGPERMRAVAPVMGLFALSTTHAFVLYARADESHIYQAMLPALPLLFVGAHVLASGLSGRARRVHRAVLTSMVALAATTLFAAPSRALLDTRPSPWHSPHLAGIDFRLRDDPYVRAAFFHDRQTIDRRTNDAAVWLDENAADDAVVLVLTREELLPLNAHLRAAGGRYRYLFYLLKNDFIDRAAFEALAPPGFVAALCAHPPAWIIAEPTRSPILDALPELEHALRTRYMRLQVFGHVWVYRRVN